MKNRTILTLATLALGCGTVLSSLAADRQIPPVNARIAEFDDACVNFASAMVSSTEFAPSQVEKVPVWKERCAMHPKQEVCRETVTMVQTYRGDSRGLNCARASIEETGRIRHYSMR